MKLSKSIILAVGFSLAMPQLANAKGGRSFSSSSARSYNSPARSYSSKSSYRSTAKPAVVGSSARKKKRSSVEYEYFPYADCSRVVRPNFNGYRCIDRD